VWREGGRVGGDDGSVLIEEDGLGELEGSLFGTRVADELDVVDYDGDDAVRLTSVSLPSSQPPKQLIYIPALILLGLIAFLQRGRAARQEVPA